MNYELILINESNDNTTRYYIKHNGRLLINDIGRRFQLELDKTHHTITFRASTISAPNVYAIMNLIRKNFGYEYTIKCL